MSQPAAAFDDAPAARSDIVPRVVWLLLLAGLADPDEELRDRCLAALLALRRANEALPVARVTEQVSHVLQKYRLKHTIEWDRLQLFAEKKD